MFANGLSAPQHSTYFVILLEGRDRDGTPGVAEISKQILMYRLAIFFLVSHLKKSSFSRDYGKESTHRHRAFLDQSNSHIK